MVVDDNQDVRGVIAMLLRSKGHEIIESDSGRDCLEKLKDKAIIPDLIFLDVMMPGMDGWLTSKMIKTNSKLKNVPVCILTAKGADMDKRMTFEYGYADKHLTKPVSKKTLLRVVEELLSDKPLLNFDKPNEKEKDPEADFEVNPYLEKHSYDFI